MIQTEDARVKLLPRELNQGVMILLNRMDSHPHEFVPDLHSNYPPKWGRLLQKVDRRMNDIRFRDRDKNADLHTPDLSFLCDEEITALYNKLQSIRGDLFTKEVMNTLLVDDSSSRELSSSFSQPKSATTKLKLSATQLMMAKKLGVSPTEYLKMIGEIK